MRHTLKDMANNKDTRMNFEKRAELTLKIWGVMIAGLVISMLFTVNTLGVWALGLALLIISAGIVTTGFMWNWGDAASHIDTVEDAEKAKRNRLSSALRDLSDSELANLQRRLSQGDINDDQLARLLEEESELGKLKR